MKYQTISTSTIEAQLPFKRKVFGVSFITTKTIGFTFTNFAKFLFYDKQKLSTGEDLKKWITDHGNERFLSEMIYAAYLANCSIKLKPAKFTFAEVLTAIQMADEETRKAIGQAWERANDFKKKQPR